MKTKIAALTWCAAVLIPQTGAAAVDPQSVDMGAFQFIPMLEVTQKRDDNIFNQPNQVESSWITQLEPTLQWLAQDRNNTYAFTYLGDYGRYWDSSDDNYDDHTVSADFHLDMNDMHTIDLAGSFGKLHDARGEGSSEGIIALSRPEPDEYDASGVNGTWAIGRPSARFGVELDAHYTDVEYTNNRFNTAFRDRDDTGFAGRFYGQVAPKTRLFAEYAQVDISYDNLPLTGSTLDSKEDRISVGVEWEATARTTGSVKIGRLDKDFDAASRGDQDFTSWEAEIIWSPRTYSHFFLATSSQPRETNGTGNFIESTDWSVAWIHDWSSYLHSVASIGIGEDDYDNNPRSDDRQHYSFSVNYDLERWINVGAGYSYTDRDSNQNLFDYDKSIFSLNAVFSL